MKNAFLRWLALSAVFVLISSCASGPSVNRSLSTPHQSSRVKYLILHYTVSDTPGSIALFTGKANAEVSVHYLLTDEAEPVVYGIVDESRAAYHAGLDAGWRGERSLNLSSIGIEIVNAGWTEGPDGRVWAPFSQRQIDTLIPLIKDIVARHRIRPENVLGHSDVAPQRKQDPGAAFPWKRLAAEGLVAWPDPTIAAANRALYQAALPDIAWFQRKLAALGYVVPQDGVLSQETRNVLIAYQTKYRPARIDGEPDAETAALLDSPMLVARAPH
jgi:N-acetylmuramoyl-L-alanine amidase